MTTSQMFHFEKHLREYISNNDVVPILFTKSECNNYTFMDIFNRDDSMKFIYSRIRRFDKSIILYSSENLDFEIECEESTLRDVVKKYNLKPVYDCPEKICYRMYIIQKNS